MGHGATSSGKYYNGCTEADVNRGCYGKLSSAQIKERIELHARRKLEGVPKIADIACHWMTKYGIEMTYPSEKQWALTPTNSALINERMEELKDAGEVSTPEISTQTLLNSLAASAKDSADNCRVLKKRMHMAMNMDCTPWGLLDITEREYFSTIGSIREEMDLKAGMILQGKKDALELAQLYSQTHISMTKELREGIKQTYSMAKYLGITENRERRKMLSQETPADIKDRKDDSTTQNDEFTEVDLDRAREEFGY